MSNPCHSQPAKVHHEIMVGGDARESRVGLAGLIWEDGKVISFCFVFCNFGYPQTLLGFQ